MYKMDGLRSLDMNMADRGRYKHITVNASRALLLQPCLSLEICFRHAGNLQQCVTGYACRFKPVTAQEAKGNTSRVTQSVQRSAEIPQAECCTHVAPQCKQMQTNPISNFTTMKYAAVQLSV